MVGLSNNRLVVLSLFCFLVLQCDGNKDMLLSRMQTRQMATSRATGGVLQEAQHVQELRRSLKGKVGCKSCDSKWDNEKRSNPFSQSIRRRGGDNDHLVPDEDGNEDLPEEPECEEGIIEWELIQEFEESRASSCRACVVQHGHGCRYCPLATASVDGMTCHSHALGSDDKCPGGEWVVRSQDCGGVEELTPVAQRGREAMKAQTVQQWQSSDPKNIAWKHEVQQQNMAIRRRLKEACDSFDHHVDAMREDVELNNQIWDQLEPAGKGWQTVPPNWCPTATSAYGRVRKETAVNDLSQIFISIMECYWDPPSTGWALPGREIGKGPSGHRRGDNSHGGNPDGVRISTEPDVLYVMGAFMALHNAPAGFGALVYDAFVSTQTNEIYSDGEDEGLMRQANHAAGYGQIMNMMLELFTHRWITAVVTQLPLGLKFVSRAKPVVVAVSPGSELGQARVQSGMTIMAVNDFVVPHRHLSDEEMHDLADRLRHPAPTPRHPLTIRFCRSSEVDLTTAQHAQAANDAAAAAAGGGTSGIHDT